MKKVMLSASCLNALNLNSVDTLIMEHKCPAAADARAHIDAVDVLKK